MKFPILTGILTIATLALYVLFGASPDALIWVQGESQPWRWISGHFVHISATHLIWNTAALALLGSIIEQHSRSHLLIGLTVGILAINLFLSTSFSMAAYSGLSGTLNTLLIIALYHLCRSDTYRNAAMLTLVGSMIKIVIEMNTGTSLVSQLIWPPVPQAHLAGWLAGLIMCVIIGCTDRNHDKLALQT